MEALPGLTDINAADSALADWRRLLFLMGWGNAHHSW
jgi:hypothetical protein